MQRRLGRVGTKRVQAMLVAIALALPLVAASGQMALAAGCLGRSPTIFGTPNNDTLQGTPGDDVIAGGDGDDVINGLGGNDRLCGGAGDDLIDSGEGLDRLDGGPGRDTVTFATATDGVFAHLGADGPARSSFDEFEGIENLTGSPFNDRLAGGPARNVIDGGGGDDRLLWYPSDTYNDQWIGGDGTDVADYSRAPGPVTASLEAGTATVAGASTGTDALASIEDISGSAFTDDLTGDNFRNVISSFIREAVAGDDDVIFGGEGNDQLSGTAGAVRLEGGGGQDSLIAYGYDAMELDGGEDDDFVGFANKKLHTFGVTTTIEGGAGNDLMYGTNNHDNMFGGPGNDTMIGEYGNDVLDGGADSDAGNGNTGNDVCIDVESPASCAQGDTADDGTVGTDGPPAFSDVWISMTPEPGSKRGGEYRVVVGNIGPDTAEVGAMLYFGGRVTEVSSVYGGCLGPSPGDVFRTDVQCSFTLGPGQDRTLSIKVNESRIARPIHTAVAYNLLFDPTMLYLAPAIDDTWDNNTATIGAQNLQLTGLEITQGIQSLRNDVVLVSERATLVRAYVESLGGRFELAEAKLKGRILGGANLGEVTARNPIDVREDPQRKLVTQSFLFELPQSWVASTHGGAYTLEVSFEGVGRKYTCSDELEDCRADVTVVSDQPTPRIVFVGIDYAVNNRVKVSNIQTATTAFKQLRDVVPISTVDLVYFKPAGPPVQGAPDDIIDFDELWLYLESMRILRGCMGLVPDCIYAGIMVDTSIDGVAGLGMGGSFVAYAGGHPHWTVGHEFTHVMGRSHTDCPEMLPQPFENYPYPDGILSDPLEGPDAYYGTSVYNGAAIPTIYQPSETHDLMSYCDPVWTSDYTWSALLSGILAEFRAPVPRRSLAPVADALVLQGRVSADGTGSFEQGLRGTAELSAQGQGDASIRFVGAGGAELSSHVLQLQTNETGESLFVAALDPPAGTAAVELVIAGSVEDRIEVSAAAPTVAIDTFDVGTEAVGISWTASDADGDELTYALDYSTDGGASWAPVGLGLTAKTASVALADLAASDTAMLRVSASDGFLSSSAQTSAFVVGEHAPQLSVINDPSFRAYLPGQELFAEVAAFDTEDGLLAGSSIEWSSDRDGVLATGAVLSVDTGSLSVGEHLVTVTAIDAAGRSDSIELPVTVFGSSAELPACRGQVATLVGTSASDTIRGGRSPEVIFGGGGGDSIFGGKGADTLCGGGGRDRLDGGPGKDSFDGGPGSDACIGPRKENRISCEARS